jgi:ferredoxin
MVDIIAKSSIPPPSLAIARAAVALMTMMMVHPAHPFVVPSSLTSATTTTRPTFTTSSSPFVDDVVVARFPSSRRRRGGSTAAKTTTTMMMSIPSSSSGDGILLTLSLDKPLGLVLEEYDDDDDNDGTGTNNNGPGGGVVVVGVNEGGSAYLSPSRDALPGSIIATVMGVDVSLMGLDDVMDAIIGAPSPVEVAFRVPSPPPRMVGGINDDDASASADASDASAPTTYYEVGAMVDIVVQQPYASPSKPDIVMRARVGDNLRKTLLSNQDVELYRGLKKKLGNCGGGGQCGFCAVELIDDSSVGGSGSGVWGARSDYEAKKIGKGGGENCRLACMNNIVGPATVRTL